MVTRNTKPGMMMLIAAVFCLAACGGSDASRSPNAGHYSGTLIANSPTATVDCSIDFVIPDAPGCGGKLAMDCTGTVSAHYVGSAFLARGNGGSYLSFDLKADRDQFSAEETPAGDDCEFVSFAADRSTRSLDGEIDGCGDLSGWYEAVLTN